ncbi:MAG: HAMP domain-containing sensor histidine kinase [Acidobacteriota bacterium]
MTLRRRLFLILGGLAASLILAQWWWVRTLTQELGVEVDSVALVVGTSVASLLSEGPLVEAACPDDDACAESLRVIQRLHTLEGEPTVIHTPAGVGTFEPRSSYTVQFDMRQAGDVVIERHSISSIDGDREASPEHDHDTAWSWDTVIERRDASPLAGDQPHDHVVEQTVRVAPRIEIVDGATAHFFSTSDHAEPTVRRFRFFGDGEAEHVHEDRFLVLDRPDGTARVPIPRRGLETKLDDFRSRLMLGSVGLLAVALAGAALLAHRVSAPLRSLAEAADEVGSGELGVQVEASVADPEVQRTVDAFNLMSRRLVELDARARRADASKHLGEIGDVARGLAHTLRNPLNALGLSVDELAARADDQAPGSIDLAEGAKRQIRRIDQGIRSFLVLARPTGGAVEPVDVGELVRDVALEALQDGAGRARVEVEVPEVRAPLDAVGPELRAAIQALVVNAVEASPDGGVVEVTLRSEPPDDLGSPRLALTVADRGAGLPDAIRDRLFTPHLSTKSNGSGMGLFLAHRVAVHRYGGSLELTDRDGGGTIARLIVGSRRTAEDTP